jgi:hypothetical protein
MNAARVRNDGEGEADCFCGYMVGHDSCPNSLDVVATDFIDCHWHWGRKCYDGRRPALDRLLHMVLAVVPQEKDRVVVQFEIRLISTIKGRSRFADGPMFANRPCETVQSSEL